MLVPAVKSYSFIEHVDVFMPKQKLPQIVGVDDKSMFKWWSSAPAPSANSLFSAISDDDDVGSRRLLWPGIQTSKYQSYTQDYMLADDEILLRFKAMNRTFQVTLKEKRDLVVPNGVRIEIDGKLSPELHEKILSKVRAYEGRVKGSENGWARLMVHDDISSSLSNPWLKNILFEGVLANDDGIYHIQAIDTYKRAKRQRMDTDIASALSRSPSQHRATMIMYSDTAEPGGNDCATHQSHTHSQSHSSHAYRRDRDSTTTGAGRTCGSDDLPYNKIILDKIATSRSMGGRNDATQLRRRAQGCGTTKQYLFMGAAADCSYVNAYGGSEGALKQILSDFNTASATYEASFNVGLALIKVNLQTACSSPSDQMMAWNQMCSAEYSINRRLSDFSFWRGNKDPDQAGLWHLLTGCTTTVSGSAVGIAWLQTTCLTSANGQPNAATGRTDFVSGTGVSSIVPTEWKVVAHEIGHNFGATHDCSQQTCTRNGSPLNGCCPCSTGCDCGGQYLMHPTDNAITGNFSTCSIKDICDNLQSSSRSSCFLPPGALASITEGICGNGVKEGSEQCDCGDDASCAKDPCCDGKLCKLKGNAVCDDLNDDCCSNCQLKSQGAVCRASRGVCDFAEVCTGQNSTCPPDLNHPDQESCGDGKTCASGICTSRNSQCIGSYNGVNTTGVCPGRDVDCQLFLLGYSRRLSDTCW